MIQDDIRIQLTNILLEAKKLSRDVARHKWEVEEWKIQHGEEIADWIIEKDEELMPPFMAAIESLHWSIICYLDSLNLKDFLQQYSLKTGNKFNVYKVASNFDIRHDPYGGEYEPYNKYLDWVGRFLSPLGILDQESAYLRVAGVQYLETVLRNSGVIINNIGIQPTTEKEVYSAVEDVLKVIFPSAKDATANFSKSIKKYNPDILIPELSAAIEYKYANSLPKLKATIGQIADDVKGYTGDSGYKIFYAVFYVTKNFFGEQKFDDMWNEYSFPINWKAFYVLGSGT